MSAFERGRSRCDRDFVEGPIRQERSGRGGRGNVALAERQSRDDTTSSALPMLKPSYLQLVCKPFCGSSLKHGVEFDLGSHVAYDHKSHSKYWTRGTPIT